MLHPEKKGIPINTVRAFGVREHRCEAANGMAGAAWHATRGDRGEESLFLPCQFSVPLDDHPSPNSLPL